MRLRVRLLVGFVAVHLLLSIVAGVVAWTWLDGVRRAQAEDSARAVGRVLAGGGFSPSPAVIERMRTLTGYAFRVLDTPESVRPGTVQVSDRAWTVEIDYRTADWHAERRRILVATVTWSVVGSTIFALLAATLAARIAGPVERLAAAARTIGAGSWERPIPAVGSGEVGELAQELEGMRQRLSDLDAAHRLSERLATLGTFTATIAHEVRNPLSAVRLTVQLLARRQPDDPALALILEEMERLDLIVDELLAFSRGMAVNPESTDLRAVIAGVVALLRRQADHAGVTVAIAGEPPPVHGDPNRLRQLAMNLLLNAIQAAQQGGGAVRIRVAADGFTIDDDGPGVPADQAPHLFEAFRSSRAEGTGLGLHLARAIAEAHGATLTHEPLTPGARFRVQGLRTALAADGA